MNFDFKIFNFSDNNKDNPWKFIIKKRKSKFKWKI
jgi:hypothetical protein